MSNLISKSFENAKRYIMTNARKLEQARFEYEFENGSKGKVIFALKLYQNKDGGFGNGIEPDFWLPKSSPMATWVAGQILMEIEANANDPIVKSMTNYLIQTNNYETGMWESVLPENNDYPHAPWWHWQEGAQKNWMFNPSAELAAFLVHWSSEKADIGWNTINKATEYLMNKEEMDKHEINNFQQLIKIIRPYEAEFNVKIQYSLNVVAEKIMELVDQCMEKDVSKWNEGYRALPLDFIDTPEDPLFERHESLVKQNLHFYLEQMSDEGIWDISWTWGSYPEEFDVARRYWKGILAIKRYKQLKAFGLLK